MARAVHRLTKACANAALADLHGGALRSEYRSASLTSSHPEQSEPGMPSCTSLPPPSSSPHKANAHSRHPTSVSSPCALPPQLRNAASALAAATLAPAIHVVGPHALPWTTSLVHTYLLLSCPHARTLLLPPC
eukprot:scaffold99193_cov21-Tisochrysis_lutea.AAC.2